tara:strand:+ start:3500 stop:3649 length:150 start_codon:yes stop_codon:yes gene_type:complete
MKHHLFLKRAQGLNERKLSVNAYPIENTGKIFGEFRGPPSDKLGNLVTK